MEKRVSKVGRMTKGKRYRGPEPFGCFNTGTAPTLYRDRVVGHYWVGAELDIHPAIGQDAKEGIKHIRAGRKPRDRRIFRMGPGRMVHRFKTRGPAVARFMDLVNQARNDIRKEQEHVQQLRQRAARGDMGAALALGDY